MNARALAAFQTVIVDDDAHMRILLRTMLRRFGISRIHEAPDGDRGFALLKAYEPDFVLTDYSMKPINGAEFVRRVRMLDAPIACVPVIMITAHTERRYIETARDSGITELLCKPVTPRDTTHSAYLATSFASPFSREKPPPP